MSGYYGYKMSNNAIEAYSEGEKPLTKWLKRDILQAIKEAVDTGEITLNCSFEALKKLNIQDLKKICLKKSSWHHTSKFYNRCDFYSLDIDSIESLTNEKIGNIKREGKKESNLSEAAPEKWRCAFIRWEGSRKHPRPVEVEADGVLLGNWFYLINGKKKSIKSNGFRFICKIE